VKDELAEFETRPEGRERVVRQAGLELTWEWLLEPDAVWAPCFTEAERPGQGRSA